MVRPTGLSTTLPHGIYPGTDHVFRDLSPRHSGTVPELYRPRREEYNLTTGLLMANAHSFNRYELYDHNGQSEFEGWKASYIHRVTSAEGLLEVFGMSAGMGTVMNVGMKTLVPMVQGALVSCGLRSNPALFLISVAILSVASSTVMTTFNTLMSGERDSMKLFKQWVSGIAYSLPSMFLGMGLMHRFGFGAYFVQDLLLEPVHAAMAAPIGIGLEKLGCLPKSTMDLEERFWMEYFEGVLFMAGGRAAGPLIDRGMRAALVEPTIHGIDMNGEDGFFRGMELIQDVHDKGARSVGLQLAPGQNITNDNSPALNNFIRLARFAEERRMRVVRLETKTQSWENGISHATFLRRSIGEAGKIDVVIVDPEIARLLPDIEGYRIVRPRNGAPRSGNFIPPGPLDPLVMTARGRGGKDRLQEILRELKRIYGSRETGDDRRARAGQLLLAQAVTGGLEKTGLSMRKFCGQAGIQRKTFQNLRESVDVRPEDRLETLYKICRAHYDSTPVSEIYFYHNHELPRIPYYNNRDHVYSVVLSSGVRLADLLDTPLATFIERRLRTIDSTPVELSRDAGIPLQILENLRRQNVRFDPDTIFRVAVALNIHPSEMYLAAHKEMGDFVRIRDEGTREILRTPEPADLDYRRFRRRSVPKPHFWRGFIK